MGAVTAWTTTQPALSFSPPVVLAGTGGPLTHSLTVARCRLLLPFPNLQTMLLDSDPVLTPKPKRDEGGIPSCLPLPPPTSPLPPFRSRTNVQVLAGKNQHPPPLARASVPPIFHLSRPILEPFSLIPTPCRMESPTPMCIDSLAPLSSPISLLIPSPSNPMRIGQSYPTWDSPITRASASALQIHRQL